MKKTPLPETRKLWKIRQVRIMLMGNTAEGQRLVGNVILGEKAFPVSEAQKSERHDGLVAGRHLAVITTADLLSSNLSEEERSQGIGRCLSLSAPGPHVLLWVQQKGTITQEDRYALRSFKESFGEGATKYAMVLFVHDDHEGHVSVGDSVRPGNGALHDFIQDCGRWYHIHSQRNHTQVTELLEKIQEIVKENGDSYFTGENFKWSDFALKEPEKEKKEVTSREQLGVELKRAVSMKPAEGATRKENRPRLSRSRTVNDKQDGREGVRIVLVGRTGVGKSAAGNTILGREAFASKTQMSSVTKKCQKETGTVAGRGGGRAVAVIDTPGLFDATLSTEDVQQEIMKCMALASPGPHVILLVISVGRFTPEERETLRLIKLTFSDPAEKYTMVLFNRGDDLGDDSIEKYIAGGNSEIKKLIEDCGGRYHVFNNKENGDKRQVIDLFKKIEKMNWENGGSCYSHEMFQAAKKVLSRIHMWKEEEVKRELEMLEAKYKSEIEDLQREKQERERRLEELQRENHKFIQREAQERAERGEQHKITNEDKEQGESLGHLTLLERKPGDEEGTEGASGTWRPEKHVGESREEGEGEENHKQDERKEQDEEGSEKQTGIMQRTGRDSSKLFSNFKIPFKRLEKMKKSPQHIKEKKKREGNVGEEKKISKKNYEDKYTVREIIERETTESDDLQSLEGEDRPRMAQRDSEKNQGEEEEKEVEDLTTEKHIAASLTEAECIRLINEMNKRCQELEKQQAEVKCFIRKCSDHFEASQRKKEKVCVIQ